jgi:hypothetical protein
LRSKHTIKRIAHQWVTLIDNTSIYSS